MREKNAGYPAFFSTSNCLSVSILAAIHAAPAAAWPAFVAAATAQGWMVEDRARKGARGQGGADYARRVGRGEDAVTTSAHAAEVWKETTKETVPGRFLSPRDSLSLSVLPAAAPGPLPYVPQWGRTRGGNNLG